MILGEGAFGRVALARMRSADVPASGYAALVVTNKLGARQTVDARTHVALKFISPKACVKPRGGALRALLR